MSPGKRQAGVALKYCGSCNPYVSLTWIAHHLEEMAERQGDFHLVPLSGDDIDIMVILCGCPRACGDKEEFRAGAREVLVVAGYSVGGKLVTDSSLLSTFEMEVSKFLERSKVS